MSIEKRIGKIDSVSFGFGGYQNAQFGLWLNFSGKAWGVSGAINGSWSLIIEWSKSCKWTEADRDAQYAQMVREIQQTMMKAGINDISELKDKPVEVTFRDRTIQSWRILDEVL